MTGMRARAHALLVLALLGAGLTACDNVLVATLADSGSDAADAMTIPCGVLDGGIRVDCPDGLFCTATSCDSSGTCEPDPLKESCQDAGFYQECGCDGVTYFNGCLRRANGATYAGMQDVCLVPATKMPLACSVKDSRFKCGPTQSCVQVFEGYPFTDIANGPAQACSNFADVTMGLGTCWVLPDACPLSSPGGTVKSCGSSCGDACKAVKDGGVLFKCQ